MLSDHTARALQDAMRREYRSLLQYVDESFPWITADEQEALSHLKGLAAEQLAGAEALARCLIANHRDLPFLGSYPMHFTTCNFVSLDHVLPQVAQSERQSLMALELDLAGVHDQDARDLLEKVVHRKKRHLEVLDMLATQHPDAAAPARTT